jgi:hypothetical protein
VRVGRHSFEDFAQALRLAAGPLFLLGVDRHVQPCVQSWLNRLVSIEAAKLETYRIRFGDEDCGCVLSRMFAVIAEWRPVNPAADASEFQCKLSDVLATGLYAILVAETLPGGYLKESVPKLFEYGEDRLLNDDLWQQRWRGWLTHLRQPAAWAISVLDMGPKKRAVLRALVSLVELVDARLSRRQDSRKDLPRLYAFDGVLVRSKDSNAVEAVGVLRDRSKRGCCMHVLSRSVDYDVGARLDLELLAVTDGSMMPECNQARGRVRARDARELVRVGLQLETGP